MKNDRALGRTTEDTERHVGYRIDLLVESRVIVELKAVEKMLPLYEAQRLSYLKQSGHKDDLG